MPQDRSSGSQSPTDAEVAAMQVKLDQERAKLIDLRERNELLRQLKRSAEKAEEAKALARPPTGREGTVNNRTRPSRGRKPHAIDFNDDAPATEKLTGKSDSPKSRRRAEASTRVETALLDSDSPEDEVFYTARSH